MAYNTLNVACIKKTLKIRKTLKWPTYYRKKTWGTLTRKSIDNDVKNIKAVSKNNSFSWSN